MAKLNMSRNQGVPQDRLAGKTIGERRQLRQAAPKATTVPAKPARPNDNFARRGATQPEQFRKKADKYASARRYSRNSPYKHVRTERLEKGAAPRPTKHITDEARVDFLDKIIKFNITSPTKVRKRFGTKPVRS